MRSLFASLRRLPILLLLLAATIAQGAQKQSADISLENRRYVPGKGTADIPTEMLQQEQNQPQMAVRSGDTIVLHNRDKVYWRPLSKTPENQFTTPAKGLAPGESKTITAKNTTDRPILLKFHDDIHASARLVIVVLPAGAEASGQSSFAGAWKTTWGIATIKLSGDGKTATGTYTYTLSHGGKAQGKISGTVVGNKLTGNWSEAFDDKKAAGTMTLTLSEDGASFAGPWKKVTGKAAEDAGEWKGTRQKK